MDNENSSFGDGNEENGIQVENLEVENENFEFVEIQEGNEEVTLPIDAGVLEANPLQQSSLLNNPNDQELYEHFDPENSSATVTFNAYNDTSNVTEMLTAGIEDGEAEGRMETESAELPIESTNDPMDVEFLNEDASLRGTFELPQTSSKPRLSVASKEPYSLGQFFKAPEKKAKKSLLPRPTKKSNLTPQEQVQSMAVNRRLNVSDSNDNRSLKKGRTQTPAYLLGKRYRLRGFPVDTDEEDSLSDVNGGTSTEASKFKAKKQRKQ